MVVGIACGQTSSMAVVSNGEVSIAAFLRSLSLSLSLTVTQIYEANVWTWHVQIIELYW